jgi:hypothetical protein
MIAGVATHNKIYLKKALSHWHPKPKPNLLKRAIPYPKVSFVVK